MPIYEYECNKCGATFEAMASMADRDKVACESCGAMECGRLASTVTSTVDEGSSGTPPPACGSGG